MRKQFIYGAFLFFSTLFLCELVANLGYRLVRKDWPRFPPSAATRLSRVSSASSAGDFEDRQINPYVGYTFDPNRHIAKSYYHGVNCQTNRLGFIGEPSLIKRSPKTFIVLVTGGSFAVDLVCLAGSKIKQLLRGTGPLSQKQIVIIGLAVDAYKQPQQLFALDYYLSLGGEFDALVNIDGFNEVVNYHTVVNDEHAAAHYPLHWATLQAAALPANGYRLMGKMAFYGDMRDLVFRILFPFRYSGVVRILASVADRLAGAQITQSEVALYEAIRTRSQGSYRLRGPKESRNSPDSVSMVALWSRNSLLMAQRASNAGAIYFHLLQPNQYVENSKLLTAGEKAKAFNPNSRAAHLIPGGYQALSLAQPEMIRKGIAIYDLRNIFKEYTQALYVDPCCHISQEGQEIFGTELANLILSKYRNLLRPGPNT